MCRGPEEEKEAAQPRPGEAWGATGPRGPSKHRGDLGTCCHFTLQRATSCLPLTPDMSKRKIALSSLGIFTSLPARGLGFMRQRRFGHLSSSSKLRQERRSVCFSQCSNPQAQRVPARAHCSGRPRGGRRCGAPLSRVPRRHRGPALSSQSGRVAMPVRGPGAVHRAALQLLSHVASCSPARDADLPAGCVR